MHAQGFAGEEPLDGARQTPNIPRWDKDAAAAGIEQLIRYAVHELAHQEHAERADHPGKHDAPVRVGPVIVDRQDVPRDDQHLRRHHQRAQNGHKDDRLEREVQLGQHVAGQRIEERDTQSCRAGHHEAVAEPAGERKPSQRGDIAGGPASNNAHEMKAELRRISGSRNHHANRHAWAYRWSPSWLVLNDAVFGSELGAVAGSLDNDLVRGVGQPVQSAIAEDGIVEQAQPFVHAAV